MCEGTEYPSLAVHAEISRGPNRRGSNVTTENRIVTGKLIERSCNVLRMDRLFASTDGSQLIQTLARLPIVLERLLQMCFVSVLLQLWQKRPDCRLCVSH